MNTTCGEPVTRLFMTVMYCYQYRRNHPGGVYGQYTYLYKLTGLEKGGSVSHNRKLTDKQDDGGWADGAMHHVSKMDFNGKMLYAVDGWKAPNRYTTIGLYQNG